MESDLEEGEVVEAEGTIVQASRDAVSENMQKHDQPFPEIVPATVAMHQSLKVRRPVCVNSSSDSDSDSDKTNHSDDDFEPPEKRLSKNVIASSLFGQSCENMLLNSTSSRQTTKYNIWGSVLQEQTLSKDISGWFGINKKVDSDRDVETYDYKNAKACIVDDDGIVEQTTEISEVNNESGLFDVGDICDKETFGAVASTKSDKRKLHDVKKSSHTNKGKWCGTDESEAQEEMVGKTPRVRDAGKKSAYRRIGVKPPVDFSVVNLPKTFNKERDRSHIRSTENDNPSAVAEEIHSLLKEPEHMKTTFLRVADVLGSKKALELLYQTEDVEANGGIKILNGSRRRTPGGVYLYLLKGDPAVTKDQYREIFKDHLEGQKLIQKAASKRRWKERVDAMEQGGSTDCGAKTDLRILPSRKDEFLANLTEPNLDSVQTDRRPAQAVVDYDEFGFDETAEIELDIA